MQQANLGHDRLHLFIPLELLLPYVDQQARLGRCALVNRDACLAAAAATPVLQCCLSSHGTTDSLRKYLEKHSQHVKQLLLSARPGSTSAQLQLAELLPSAVMQQLEVVNLNRLQLTNVQSLSQLLTPLAAVPALTHLVLDSVGWDSSSPVLKLGLAGLTNLRELHLVKLQSVNPRCVDIRQALVQLQQLTHLHVHGTWATSPVLGNLKDVTGLQHLHLQECVVKEAVLSSIQHMQQLSFLQLSSMGEFSVQDSNRTLTALSQLTMLQQLRLHKLRSVNAQTLAKIPAAQLQHLEISSCGISGGGVQALMPFLAGAQSLQSLNLAGSLKTCILQGYAALTAGTGLTSLDLSGCKLGLSTAVPQMFTRNSTFPSLRRLMLHNTRGMLSDECKLDQLGLTRLVACCPGLQELQMYRVLGPAVRIKPFTALQQLTALEITDLNPADVHSLSRVAALRHLHIREPHSLQQADVLPLTSLQMLTHLCIQGCINKPLTVQNSSDMPDLLEYVRRGLLAV